MSRAAQVLSHKKHRRRHLSTLMLLAILAIWAGLWAVAAHHLNARLDQWAQDAKKAGIQFTYAEQSTDGSPWMLHIHLTDFVFKHPKGHRVEATEAILHLPLWNWNTLSIKFKGLIRGQIDKLSFTSEALKLGVTRHTSDSTEDKSLDVHGVLLGLTPHINFDPPLGRRIAKLSFDFSVLGKAPSFDKPKQIKAWSQSGGSFQIERLALSWGPLRLIGEGTMALNENLQPEGILSTRLRGITKSLSLSRRQSYLSPMEEKMLKVSLKVLSRPTGLTNSGSPVVPFSIQHAGLYIGPVKLVPIPAIGW